MPNLQLQQHTNQVKGNFYKPAWIMTHVYLPPTHTVVVKGKGE